MNAQAIAHLAKYFVEVQNGTSGDTPEDAVDSMNYLLATIHAGEPIDQEFLSSEFPL